jgi:hypothetical protein
MLCKFRHGEAIRLTQPNDSAVVLPGLYVEGNKTYTVQDDGYDAEQQDEPGCSSFVGTLIYGFSVRSSSMEIKCSGVLVESGREGAQFRQSLHRQRKLPGTLSMFSSGCFDDAVSMNLEIQ